MIKKRSLESISLSILNSDAPEEEKVKIMKAILGRGKEKINVMIIGSKGCGKSSTVNALFNIEKAKVGVDSSLKYIEKYKLDNLIIWDCPGFVYGEETENIQKKHIANKLKERDKKGNLLIDLVLVILDGSAHDFETTYEIINEIVIPNFGDNRDRILVAVNKVDMVMNGRYWNNKKNKPKDKLLKFLNEKSALVQKEIKEVTGLDVEPIYYNTGYTKDGRKKHEPYNISKLLYCLSEFLLKKKRNAAVKGGIGNNLITWWWDC